MLLALQASTERGKTITKTGNEYINIDLTVHHQKIGSIELYLMKDTEQGCDTDEWLLKYYTNDTDSDPEIIAQGNLKPVKKEI